MHVNLLRALAAASDVVCRSDVDGYVQLVSTSEPDAHTLRLWFVRGDQACSIDGKLSIEQVQLAEWPDDIGARLARMWLTTIRRTA